MAFKLKNKITINKKKLLGGFIVFIITFIILLIAFIYRHNGTYYQIIFDSDGGSEVSGQNVLIGSQASPPSTTKKEGYIFKGWYLGKEKYNFSSQVRKDLTLKAKWEKVDNIIDKETKEEIKNNAKNNETKPNTDNKNTPSTNNNTTNNNNNQNNNSSNSSKTPAPAPAIVNVSSVSLNTRSVTLKVGDSTVLVANIQPSNATNKTVTWTSSNSAIVSVSGGVIRGISPGTAVITASVNGKTSSCTVTVPQNITYNYEIVDITSSAIGQCYIYIKRSDGQRVGGTLEISYINGTSERIQITASGIMRVRSTISSVKVLSAG